MSGCLKTNCAGGLALPRTRRAWSQAPSTGSKRWARHVSSQAWWTPLQPLVVQHAGAFQTVQILGAPRGSIDCRTRVPTESVPCIACRTRCLCCGAQSLLYSIEHSPMAVASVGCHQHAHESTVRSPHKLIVIWAIDCVSHLLSSHVVCRSNRMLVVEAELR